MKKCYMCKSYLTPFLKKEKLESLEIDCMTINFCKIKLPAERDDILKFRIITEKSVFPAWYMLTMRV